jgi:acetolactate synthase-1/2/3 large subunit
MIKVSDYVFDFIASKEIDTVFTVSGGGCMHLIDSLGKNKHIKYICNHHEQASAIAAEGYARVTNKPGCVLVTTGPGGTNALTGVLCAYQDSIPMIVISGQVPSDQLSNNTGCRQIGQQEFNIVQCVTPMVKYAKTVLKAEDIKYILEEAYHEATSGRPGPVWIDIPLNIQSTIVDLTLCKEYISNKNINFDNKVQLLKQLLENSKKPVVVVGNGIRVSNTVDLLRKFLNFTNLPVMTGPHSAVDAVNSDYLYYAGRFGLLGQYTSNHIIQESDFILSLGSRLNPKMIGYDSNKFAPNAIKFLIDIDSNEMKKLNFENKVEWNIDLKDFFDLINLTDFNLDISDWQKRILETRSQEKLVLDKHKNLTNHVSTYVFAEKLQYYLNNDSIIVTSDGTAHVIPLKTMSLKSNQRLFSNEGTAPMGYGLPAAIGAYFGSKKPIICLEGDGSIMMNLQELETIRYHKIPLKLFIINNEGYLSIKLTQNSFFKGNLVASEKSSGVSIPSFSQLAQVFGFRYFNISSNNDIDNTLAKIFTYSNEPIIIEVFTDPNEQHEPKVIAKGIDQNGNIIPGELTNMNININLNK